MKVYVLTCLSVYRKNPDVCRTIGILFSMYFEMYPTSNERTYLTRIIQKRFLLLDDSYIPYVRHSDENVFKAFHKRGYNTIPAITKSARTLLRLPRVHVRMSGTSVENPMWITRKIDWQKKVDPGEKLWNTKNHSHVASELSPVPMRLTTNIQPRWRRQASMDSSWLRDESIQWNENSTKVNWLQVGQ